MKALVYEGPRTMNMRECETPEPKAGELLLKVERVGICGSELSGYLGHNSLRKPPLIMGHEFSGTVCKLGAGTARFAIGDRVTANPLVTCGRCRACTNGASQLCAQRKLLGAHAPGAFAEFVAVPEHNALLLPDHVSIDEGALTEPVACAVHICRLLKPHPADKLLIMGAGPIGLLVLQVAQTFGLKQIAVIDIKEERLRIARELGAATATALSELAKGAARFDGAVDAVGMEATRNACLEAVKPGATVIWSGLHEEASRLPANYLIRSELRLIGAFAYHTDDFEDALRLLSDGSIRLSPWTLHAPLEQGGASFEQLLSGPGAVAKILLAP